MVIHSYSQAAFNRLNIILLNHEGKNRMKYFYKKIFFMSFLTILRLASKQVRIGY